MRLCSRVAASAVFVAITATAAQSHSPGIGGGEAATLKQGHFTFSTDYEFIKVRPLSDAAMAAAVTPSTHVHSLKSIAAVAAAIAYGVTDDLTVALRLPWVSCTGIREAHVHDPLEILCRFINWGDLSGHRGPHGHRPVPVLEQPRERHRGCDYFRREDSDRKDECANRRRRPVRCRISTRFWLVGWNCRRGIEPDARRALVYTFEFSLWAHRHRYAEHRSR